MKGRIVKLPSKYLCFYSQMSVHLSFLSGKLPSVGYELMRKLIIDQSAKDT